MSLLSQVTFFSVVLFIVVRGFYFIRAGRPGPVLVSLVAVIVYVVCLWIPARLQAYGIIESKLENARFLVRPTLEEISSLSWRWALELVIIFCAEWVAWSLRRRRRGLDWHQEIDLRPSPILICNRETLAVVLLLVGVAATILFPAPDLEDRAVEGQGLGTILRTFLIVGIAYVVYNRGFGKFRWWAVAAFGIGVLASTNVRSPLLVIVFAFIAAEISGNRLRSFKRVAITISLVVVFAISGSYMSNWRENVTRHQGETASQVLTTTLDAPWVQIYESGVDTLDGYRFSQHVAPLEESRPEDLLNVVLTFVPRALWDDKPVTISVDLSAKYLNYGASGQYLSPIGYLTIALGSYTGALLGIFVFVLSMALLVRRYLQSFILTIVLCVTFRFMLGGSSFDLYYGLTLLLPYCLTVVAVAACEPRSVIRSSNRSVSL